MSSASVNIFQRNSPKTRNNRSSYSKAKFVFLKKYQNCVKLGKKPPSSNREVGYLTLENKISDRKGWVEDNDFSTSVIHIKTDKHLAQAEIIYIGLFKAHILSSVDLGGKKTHKPFYKYNL